MIDLHLAGLRHMKVCFLFVFTIKYNVTLTEHLTAHSSAQPESFMRSLFLPALLISVNVRSVFFLLFGTNYPPLLGSPTHWKL